jgi:hypothetical protein
MQGAVSSALRLDQEVGLAVKTLSPLLLPFCPELAVYYIIIGTSLSGV